jgi:hypothetical protein
MPRTLLQAENPEIFKDEVGAAIGTCVTDRLVTRNPSATVNPFNASVPIALNTTTQIRAKALVRQRSGSNVGQSACIELLGTFKNVSGTVTEVGTPDTICNHNDSANWSLTFTISNDRVLVNAVYASTSAEAGNTNVWTLYLYTFSVGE